MKPRRILAISNLYPPAVVGGYEQLCGEIMTRAAAQGLQVTVLTAAMPDLPPDEMRDGVRVLRRLSLTAPFQAPPELRRGELQRIAKANRAIVSTTLHEHRPDCIALWSQLRLTAGPTRGAVASGIPHAFVLNDLNWLSLAPRRFSPDPRGLVGWGLDRTWYRESKLAGIPMIHATAISRLVRDGLAAGGLPASGAEIIHQGIRLEDFPLRDEPGTMGSPPRLLYVGTLIRQKGVHTLADAVQILHRQGFRVDLTIAGDGAADFTADLKRRCDGLPGLQWLGRVPHAGIGALYRQHDALIFPSLHGEGFGLTFLEAMASGLPVIASDTGGHAECLHDGVDSLIFPAGDADALAERIRRLVQDARSRTSIALAGRRLVEQHFTLDRYASSLLAFFARCPQA